MDDKRFLEGCEKISEGRYRIRENFVLSKDNMKKLPLTESTSIIESNGKKEKCIAIYEFNVWRLNEKNLNERIYTEELADHVIKNFPSSLGLMNHPTSEVADMKDVFAVEKNPIKKEGWLKVECWLVGKHGQLIEDILQAGGKIGGSSSVLGSLDDEGKVQLSEDFMLERYLDIVDSPSNSYFNTLESSSTMKEQIDNKSTILKENINEKKENKMVNKKSSLEEKIFIKYINDRISEISKLDVDQKVKEYSELLENFEDDNIKDYNIKSLKESVSKSYEESKKEYDKLIQKGKETDSLKETKKQLVEKYSKLEKDNKLLEKKYEKVCEIADQLKEFYKKYKALLEIEKASSNGKINADDYINMTVYSKELESKLENLIVKNKKLFEQTLSLGKQLKDKSKKLAETESKIKNFIESKKREIHIKKIKEQKSIEENKKLQTELRERELDRLKQNQLNIRNDHEVEKYFEEKVKVFPHIRQYEKRIKSCKTLSEAYKVFLDVKDLGNNTPVRKIEESQEDTNKKYKNVIDTSIPKGWD